MSFCCLSIQMLNLPRATLHLSNNKLLLALFKNSTRKSRIEVMLNNLCYEAGVEKQF